VADGHPKGPVFERAARQRVAHNWFLNHCNEGRIHTLPDRALTTGRASVPKIKTPASSAALKAWETRPSPVYRARRTAVLSQEALTAWARERRWHLVFLDAPSGNPRTGIVDAVLIRVGRRDADRLELRLVQLKAGSAGLTARERQRLSIACSKISTHPAYAFFANDLLEVDMSVPSDGRDGSPEASRR
jgi:hypothetical protein